MRFGSEPVQKSPEVLVSWEQLSPAEQHTFQGEVAKVAYVETHPDVKDSATNEIMLWWIQSGYAAIFGNRVLPFAKDGLDVNDPEAPARFWRELCDDAKDQ